MLKRINIKSISNNRLFSSIHLIILVITIALLFYIANRGLDFADESLYALLTNPFQKISFSPINYDLLFKALYKQTGDIFSISGLRILRILSVIIGASIFYLGVKRLSTIKNRNSISQWNLFLFIVCSSFFSNYHFILQTPGYNEISLFAIQIFSGSFLVLLLDYNLSVFKILFFIFITLLGAFLLLLAKPTGFPFISLFSIFLFGYKINQTTIIRFTITWLVIIVFLFLFPLSKKISVGELYKVFLAFNKSSTNHSFTNLWINFFIGGIIIFVGFCVGFYFFSLVRKGRINSYLLNLLGLCLVGIIIFDYVRAVRLYSQTNNFFTYYFFPRICYLIPIATGATYSFFIEKSYITREFVLFSLMAILLFLASFFGTDGYMPFFFPRGLPFLLISLYFIFESPRTSLVLVIISGLMFAKFLFTFFALKPFNQDYIFNAKVPFRYGHEMKSEILLDSISFKNISNFKELITKYSSPYVIGYDRLEGYIYLSGKTYPGSYLWGQEDVESYFRYKFNYPSSFILVVTKNQQDEIMPYLNRYSIKEYAKISLKNFDKKGQIPFVFFWCERK